jgi:hypothetical protein
MLMKSRWGFIRDRHPLTLLSTTKRGSPSGIGGYILRAQLAHTKHTADETRETHAEGVQWNAQEAARELGWLPQRRGLPDLGVVG